MRDMCVLAHGEHRDSSSGPVPEPNREIYIMSNLNKFLQICAGAFAASVIATTLMVGVTLAAEAKPARAHDHLCFSYEDGFLPCP